MNETSLKARVRILAYEHPEWIPILKACITVAKRSQSSRIAGSWVYTELRTQDSLFLPNNLRLLVRAGILTKSGESVRGGHRAYYEIQNIEEIDAAIKDLPAYQERLSKVAQAVVKKVRGTVKVPFYANLASCGSTNASEAHVDKYIEIDTHFAKPGSEYFLVRADGDSMDLAGISSGDLLLIRVQDQAEPGQKVVACSPDGVTVKELKNGLSGLMLVPRSANKEHKPIPFTEDTQIQGVVVTTIAQHD